MSRSGLAILLTAVVALGLTIPRAARAQTRTNEDAHNKVTVGTFDSRAVAVAYYRSAAFRQRLKELQAELTKAKADGNTELAEQLSAKGPTMQELAHKQTFSTWPIREILAEVKSKLPTIAQSAKVDVIVSKWNVAYQRDDIKPVDVTIAITELFQPDAKTRKIIGEVADHEPLTLEEIDKHHD